MSKNGTNKIYLSDPEPKPTDLRDIFDESAGRVCEQPPPPAWTVIFRLVLALMALTAAAALTFSVFTEYTHTYITAVPPTVMAASEAAPPVIGASEADIPEPVYVPLYYDFTQPVPESPAVDYSYFDNTVFIGDSRTKGLILYTDISPYDFSSEGTNVGTVQTKAFIRMKNENGKLQSYTLFEALEREKGNYHTVYIALGLNELGWPLEKFDTTFRELIENLRAVTDVPLYIQLIMPVTARSSATSQFGITNEKGVIFNEYLRSIAAELELFYLDTTHMFTLEDGTLDPAHASDGVHYHRESYKQIADYYRTHIVDVEAYENTRTLPPEEIEGAVTEGGLTEGEPFIP